MSYLFLNACLHNASAHTPAEPRKPTAERIHDHLVLLGFDPPHPDTIRKYMVKPKRPRKPSQTWLTFFRNHLDESWAIDFCTVPTATFNILYVVLEHGRRRVLHFNVTRVPTIYIMHFKERRDVLYWLDSRPDVMSWGQVSIGAVRFEVMAGIRTAGNQQNVRPPDAGRHGTGRPEMMRFLFSNINTRP